MKNQVLILVFRILVLLFVLLMFAYIASAQTNDYRGIIHLHSELSHDSDGKFEDIVEAAKNNEIDFIVLTDHWSPTLYEQSKRGFFGNTLFVAGAEISKNEGVTIIALPLPKDFVPENDWRDNLASLHTKGSLALANHIEFSKTSSLVNFDGIEIINLHAHILQQNKFGLVFTYLQALLPWNWNLAYIFDDVPSIPRWHYLNQSVPMPAFGGNDTHDNYRLFWVFGPKLGSYNNTFKLVTTHIWAPELSEKSVKEAIQKGQSYFAFEVFGNSKGFRFYVKETTLIVEVPQNDNPLNTKIKILRDGKKMKEGSGVSLNLQNPKPGNYYAEVWKNGKPWIFSNPIKITEK